MEVQQTATSYGAKHALAKFGDDFGAETPMAPLNMIDESPFNPRKTFGGLAELGASLRDRWLVPLLVRPHPKITGRYELVDGARRYRAAKQAALHDAPINLAHMSDMEVMIAQHVSYQREDLRELERAESYRKLMTEAGLSAKEIAKRIGGGVSVETVYARLKLLDATEPVKAALNAGTITAGHGVLIARLEPKDQERALRAACIDAGGEVMSVRELARWIEWEARDQKQRAERKAHPPAKRPASKPAVDWQAQRAKEEEKRNRERAVRRAIFDAALEGVKAPLEREELVFIAEGFLGHDDESEANAKALPTMKPQRLGHLLIELSLDRELEAWGGSKPERLLAFAKRHKVNVERVRARVEAEFKKTAAEKKLEGVGLLSKTQTAAQPKTAKAGAK
jgi:ParB/RepB/Spo0J family partition protein